ncbi:MAG: bifunctional demethylmenaquinone methyltransferase/2-methoxy-6-polyprenyl-1,4-benzoquinol methylase UbiE [Verrucomicrobia bacterium]|nr:bifunctional demethylmenaquinone methyltransferase/2-methoxy-6-polyprenyl-1,4-benzoquinol methylase UbiE [Verrucomicrobiota bacterium]
MSTSTSVDHSASSPINPAARDAEQVREMFSRISGRYDFANHFLSAGCDFLWRNRAAEIVSQWRPPCILDLATGSGDLALALQRKLPRSRIIAVDFSAEMLALAKRKGVRETLAADALRLPFAPQSFDAVTVAFGLRNMHDYAAALREMRRILTSKGHLLVLDFSLPQNAAVRQLYRTYLHHILPRLCTVMTRDKTAYEYLGASIETFPRGEVMCDLINTSGFVDAQCEPLTAGIVSIYTASAGAVK